MNPERPGSIVQHVLNHSIFIDNLSDDEGERWCWGVVKDGVVVGGGEEETEERARNESVRSVIVRVVTDVLTRLEEIERRHARRRESGDSAP